MPHKKKKKSAKSRKGHVSAFNRRVGQLRRAGHSFKESVRLAKRGVSRTRRHTTRKKTRRSPRRRISHRRTARRRARRFTHLKPAIAIGLTT